MFFSSFFEELSKRKAGLQGRAKLVKPTKPGTPSKRVLFHNECLSMETHQLKGPQTKKPHPGVHCGFPVKPNKDTHFFCWGWVFIGVSLLSPKKEPFFLLGALHETAPSQADFSASKAFDYDRAVNYYEDS